MAIKYETMEKEQKYFKSLGNTIQKITRYI